MIHNNITIMSLALKKFRPLCGITCMAFHASSCHHESHYDVLMLKPTCTEKDIRSAFIMLSKKHHPDANLKSTDSHSKFIKINEAYSILGKPEKRREYDLLLVNEATIARNWNFQTSAPEAKAWRDETLWHMRNTANDRHYADKPYYGIKGLGKISNSWIVLICVVFTAIGVGLSTLAIRNSFTMSRDLLDQHSQENSKVHLAVKQQAELNGNQRQLQLVHMRLQSRQD